MKVYGKKDNTEIHTMLPNNPEKLTKKEERIHYTHKIVQRIWIKKIVIEGMLCAEFLGFLFFYFFH